MDRKNTAEDFFTFGLTLLLKLFLLCTILYPAYSVEKNNSYFVRLVLPNLIILLIYGWYVLNRPRETTAAGGAENKTGSRIFSFLFIGILILYNIVTYFFNGLQNQWYWDQVNYSIGFLFFLFLLFCISQKEIEQMGLFRFMLLVTVISMLCCYLAYSQNLQSLNIRWLAVSRNEQREGLGIRCSWLYPHKSQYALVILMSLFAVIRHRRRFAAKWAFWGLVALHLGTLYICDTMAAFGGLLAGLAGLLLDYLYEKGFRINWFFIGGAAVLSAAAAVIVLWINRERDWATLGSRTLIWKGAIQTVLENPKGVGLRFGTVPVPASEWWATDNCHNIFLNHALRYSIPAGILFTLLILLLILFTFYRSRNFFTAGTWLGILMIMNMDYSLIPVQFPYFILLVYFLYIYKPPAST